MLKIRSITATTTLKNSETKPFKSLQKEFDENGNLLSEIKYNKDGEITSRHYNIYNDKALLEKSEYVDNEHETSETHEYFYDDNGNLIKETTDFGQGFLSVFVFEKDFKNNQIRIIEQDEDDEIEETKVQTFDEDGNLLEEISYNDANKEILKTINIFDHNKRIIKKEEHDLRYKTVQIHEYYYSNEGLLEGIKSVNKKGRLLNWVKIEYDENKRPTQQTSMNGALISIEYDGDNKRKEKHLDAGGNVVFESELELNEKGNVIVEHSPENIIHYTYEYFD
ncbi:MAG: hypothetical protein GX879_05250 [Bacteroidales bacterium]|nr:hypothetical protein [Bacteroidales bacterium]